LAEHIRRVHKENYGVYGARKIWLSLNLEGIAVAAARWSRSGADLACGADSAPRPRPRLPHLVADLEPLGCSPQRPPVVNDTPGQA